MCQCGTKNQALDFILKKGENSQALQAVFVSTADVTANKSQSVLEKHPQTKHC